MALKEKLFDLIDNAGLADVFSRKQAKPDALRRPLLKGIERTEAQFGGGQTKGASRWWQVNNDVVAFTVKLRGDTLAINGQTTNHIPAERFPDFLTSFKGAVAAGEFDEELRHHGEGEARVAVPRASRQGAVSPEVAKARGQKAAATRAANKARREAADA